jgi:outer membrane protein OmpA-like peptidoglycan-associated protein
MCWSLASIKIFVNADTRKALNELMEAWKCRYVNIEVAGHTDSVGKESDNLNLSELRAQGVRNYLWAGVSFPPASRLASRGKATCRCRRLTASACVVIAWL